MELWVPDRGRDRSRKEGVMDRKKAYGILGLAKEGASLSHDRMAMIYMMNALISMVIELAVEVGRVADYLERRGDEPERE